MLLDDTFRVHTAGSRRWRFKALMAMTVIGAICSLVTLQPTRSTAGARRAVDDQHSPAPPTPATAMPKPTSTSQNAPFKDWTPEEKEVIRAEFRADRVFEMLGDAESRKQFTLTEEQEQKFQTIEKEIADQTRDALKTKDKALAVLTPEQRLQLPKEALGPERPRDYTAPSVVVKGEKEPIQVPSPCPYPDLSEASEQKALGFNADQKKQVRAILGDCANANELLAREALRFTPKDREAQAAHFCWCIDMTLLSKVANAPDRKKALEIIRSERQTWRTNREKQPLVKRALELRKQLEAVLTPEQLTKYKEMAFAEIADAALNDPLVLTKIGVSSEQQAAVQRIYKDAQTKEFAFLRQTSEKMLKVLDPQQKERVLDIVRQLEEEEFVEEDSKAIEAKKRDARAPSKKAKSIWGRVLYHDGSPAANASVFLVGSGVSAGIGQGKAWQGERSDMKEDKTVVKATTDATGRFKLPGGDDVKSIAISAPRLDFWVAPVPDWVPVADGDDVARPEFTIKLPEPGRLVVKYDIPGGATKADLFLQMDTWDSPVYRGVGYTPGSSGANKGQVVLDNLPPGKYYLDRPKTIAYSTQFCDRRLITIESGKTLESNFIRDRGTAVVGQVVGLKKEMCASVCAALNTAGAFISVRSPKAKGGVISDMKLPLFDILMCGLDGRFKTEQLLPGKYAIVVETWLPEKPEEMRSSGIRRSSFIGRTIVTVHESGPPLQVTVELKPRVDVPPAKPGEKGKKPNVKISGTVPLLGGSPSVKPSPAAGKDGEQASIRKLNSAIPRSAILYGPPYCMIADPSIRKEMKLSAEQDEKLRKISAAFALEYQKLHQEIKRQEEENLPAKEMQKKSADYDRNVNQLIKDCRKQIEDVVTLPQLDVYKKRALPMMLMTLLFDPKVEKAIGITREQLEKSRRGSGAEGVVQQWQERIDRTLALLNPEQQARFRTELLQYKPEAHEPMAEDRESAYAWPINTAMLSIQLDGRNTLGLSAEKLGKLKTVESRYNAEVKKLRLEERKLAPEERERNGHEHEYWQKHVRATREARRQIMALLTPEQVKALGDLICRQEAGLLSISVVQDKIGLNDQQKTALKRLSQESSDKFSLAQQKMQEKSLDVFTPQQQKQLREELDRRGW